MANLNYTTTIAIDTDLSVFHFYSMVGTNTATIAHYKKSFSGTAFDEEFFAAFKIAIKKFTKRAPSESIRKVSVILPDSAVLTDTVRIPTMKGFGQTKKMLENTLSGLFRNYADLHIISNVAAQNKQYTTFSIAAVQKRIVNGVYAACAENKLLVDTLTYASSAAVCGATVIDPSLKNKSFLFLDIKETFSRFAFVAGGKTVGSYMLPFGLSFLRTPKYTQEDMLFDHSYAELTVLNARERARSKKLTIMDFNDETADAVPQSEYAGDGILPETDPDAADDAADEELLPEEGAELEEQSVQETADTGENGPSRPMNAPKIFTRRSPRKLPKFMKREIPEDEEGIACENFRVFVKWALTLIDQNPDLVELGKPESVYVNLPLDFLYVLSKANTEEAESGISFIRLPANRMKSLFLANLELYGGLHPKLIASSCKL